MPLAALVTLVHPLVRLMTLFAATHPSFKHASGLHVNWELSLLQTQNRNTS
jgi:hypothetical protein